jgi:hypothetical protein
MKQLPANACSEFFLSSFGKRNAGLGRGPRIPDRDQEAIALNI